MPEPVIVDRVTKRFAGHTAVDALSLSVPSGVIYGLLGPNGAGKTTTIRMIMDIYEPDDGSIRLFNDVAGGRTHSARIGYLPEERGLYPKMRVLDVLIFLAEIKGVTRRAARAAALQWLERLGLGDWGMRKVSDLSKGMQQKVQFISAVLHDPELVVLDEPFSALDPVNRQVLLDTVIEYRRQGKTVLFSTHIMEQAEKMCDWIVIIARGRTVVNGALSDVKSEFGGRHVALTFTRNRERAARVLADRSLIEKLDDYGPSAEVELAATGDADRLLRTLVQEEVGLSRFEVVEPSLQSIFIAKVGADAATAPAREVVHA